MKLLKRSPNGKMLNVGEDVKSARWYYIAGKIKEIADTIKDGEEVTIQYDQISGAHHLSFLAKGKVEPPPRQKKEEVKKGDPPASSHREHSPQVQKSIRRQAIGHMTSRTLIALQGLVNENNVESLIEKIYKKYIQVVES